MQIIVCVIRNENQLLDKINLYENQKWTDEVANKPKLRLYDNFINSHQFIYSHREVSNHNSLPWAPDHGPLAV